jgi:hypothetical protein
MNNARIGIFAFATLAAVPVLAASDAQIARLGQDLTPVGAEKAGSKDGAIPVWNGGELTAPSAWKAGQPRPDPYATEKALFSITAANVSQYKDKLSPGQIELLKTIKGYRMDVYPTHRSCGFPEPVYQRTRENAKIARLAADGYNLEAATGAGIPFPLPDNGAQAMWNHKLRWQGEGRIEPNYTMLSPQRGGSDFLRIEYVADYLAPYQSLSTHTLADAKDVELYFYQETTAPAALAGTLVLGIYHLSHTNEGWQYFPGQRRVRRLSTYAYDAPLIGLQDTYYVDQAWMYNGTLDRYDFKLAGKQELLVPYNSFQLRNAQRFKLETLFGKDMLNPDARRYELHRVWRVEATVKQGMRHSAPKRTFYLDEDTWDVLVEDLYDAQGKIQRVAEGSILPAWELGACISQEFTSYDLPSGRYFGDVFTLGEPETDWLAAKEGRLKPEMFTVDYLRRAGAR